MARKRYSPKERELFYEEQRGICGICGKSVTFFDFTLDHIIPLSKGGLEHRSNIQIAHKTCNRQKDDRVPSRSYKRVVVRARPLKPIRTTRKDLVRDSYGRLVKKNGTTSRFNGTTTRFKRDFEE